MRDKINDKFAKQDKADREQDDALEFAAYVAGTADLIDCSDHVGFVKRSLSEPKVGPSLF